MDSEPLSPAVSIRIGTRNDYLALQRFHYVANAPATIVQVLRACAHDEVVGVLVVSMPTLNGWWRERAWPGWLRPGLTPRERAGLINRQLRTISRVIVDPRFRSMGLATALVRAYLARPLTPRTEAIASMASVCPIFQRAGMRVIHRVGDAHMSGLRARLKKARVKPWELMDTARVARAAARGDLEDILRKWADRESATRRWRTAPLAELAARAGWAALAHTVVCVHGGQDDGKEIQAHEQRRSVTRICDPG